MILRFQGLEYEKRPKVIDFEFDSISKALDFLMKGRLVSDFEFDVSQHLLYTRGSVDTLVYQVTLLDKESGENIDLKDFTFKVIARYIDELPIIEKICPEEELMDFVEKSKALYPNERLPVYTYNGLPTERVV